MQDSAHTSASFIHLQLTARCSQCTTRTLVSVLVVYWCFLSFCNCLPVWGLGRQLHWQSAGARLDLWSSHYGCNAMQAPNQNKKKFNLFYLQKVHFYLFFNKKITYPLRIPQTQCVCLRGMHGTDVVSKSSTCTTFGTVQWDLSTFKMNGLKSQSSMWIWHSYFNIRLKKLWLEWCFINRYDTVTTTRKEQPI